MCGLMTKRPSAQGDIYTSYTFLVVYRFDIPSIVWMKKLTRKRVCGLGVATTREGLRKPDPWFYLVQHMESTTTALSFDPAVSVTSSKKTEHTPST